VAVGVDPVDVPVGGSDDGEAIAETVPSGTFTMSSRLSEVTDVTTNSVAAEADSG
jgi:hypothetical protein